MVQKIKNWVNRLSVKKKLIFYGYAIITPVLVAICVGMVIHNYRAAKEDQLQNNLASVESLSESINMLQSDIKDYTTYICLNQQIRDLLVVQDKDKMQKMNADARLWQEQAPMGVVQDMISLRGEIKTIAIYPENGIRPYLRGMDGSVHLSTIEDVKNTDIYQETIASKTGTVWRRVEAGGGDTYLTSRTEKIVLYREIFDLSKKKTLGYIVIGVGKEKFEGLCETSVKGNEGAIVLDPNEGMLVTSGHVDEKVLEYLSQGDFLAQDYRTRDNHFEYGKYDIVCKQLYADGSIVCKMIPKKDLKAQIMSMTYMPVFLLIGILIGMLPLLLIISNFVTKPLRKLSEAITHFSEGDFEQQVEVTTEDEVGEVARCFNKMVGDIKKLIDENYVIKLSEKESELAALQAQINPHFLYNTLDSLYWQATEAGNDEIAESILDLSQLFRLVLNQGKSVVTIEQEINLITHYLQIQKMRFPRKINYEITVAPEVAKVKIPKLILQPFVENAIVHGFENVSTACLLTVCAERREDYVRFVIKDDGIGMNKEQLASLWESEPANYSKVRIGRYAIKNIRERLQLRYHDAFHLEILSDVGRGTTVILEVPYEEGDSDAN